MEAVCILNLFILASVVHIYYVLYLTMLTIYNAIIYNNIIILAILNVIFTKLVTITNSFIILNVEKAHGVTITVTYIGILQT